MSVYSFEVDDPDNPFRNINTSTKLLFGAIELAPDGRIVSYHDTEPGDGGFPGVIDGKNFFNEIAPWAKGTMIETAFREGLEKGDVNTAMDCHCPAGTIRIHLKISPIFHTHWIFFKRIGT